MGQQGRGRTAVAVSVIGVICAVTVVGATAGPAFASPAPDPASTPFPYSSSSAPPGSASPPGSADGGTTSSPDTALEAVRAKLDALYHDAAVATDAYNAAEEKADKQSAAIGVLDRRIEAARVRLADLKDRAGAAARAQYRGGGLPPEARLMLSEDPGQFLDGAGLARQGEHAADGLLTELARTRRELKRDAEDAEDRWQKLEQGRKQKAAAKKRVERQIAAAKQLASRLEKKEKERLAELERAAAHRAQTAWLGSGVLDEIRGRASERGRKAVAFATAQLGKPYVWGAEGPASYDCSGLTSQAWAAAGVPVPRTSQEQWRQLPHVDIRDMRPGDLIIYFDDASHVGIYVGDGLVLHAPRPGRTVTTAGAGTMPILGVVRPDAK
ncbi:NlpC/P60 family protein [Streptomyces sp. NPDC090306]|uniref:C40 family peptidase n=1 Tax=Streptomyces sp. NPDC090306 TaxID=3365961 RepID=UPI00382D148D